ASYLGEHENVFMSALKEPHYFATDFIDFRPYYVKSESEYLALFQGVTERQLAIGEASVWYLYSQHAARNIYAFDSTAKIIVMLRNPVELIYSLYSQYLYSMVEEAATFSEAWRLQDDRASGKKLPPAVRRTDQSARLMQYGQIGKLGYQVKQLFEIFPTHNVKIFLHDDLLKSTRNVYVEALQFLGIPDDGRKSFPRINENKQNRSQVIANLTQYTPTSLWLKSALSVFGIKNTGVLRLLQRFNANKTRRDPLSPEMKADLHAYFREDIHLLSDLINRNLDHWLVD
ncbi:MAG: sulfotransferase domain-containing protein, partial [Anaerolineae bacterium]|nr:sulfotransferase domain-containing protein [Anaerolineae bacterium]